MPKANERVFKLRHNSTKLPGTREKLGSSNEKSTEFNSTVRRIEGDVTNDGTEVSAGRGRKDYLIIHEGSSRSTSSIGIDSPTIELFQSLSHCRDKLDLLGNVMQRSTVGHTLKQILNNLFVAHDGSVHSEVSFFKRCFAS